MGKGEAFAYAGRERWMTTGKGEAFAYAGRERWMVLGGGRGLWGNGPRAWDGRWRRDNFWVARCLWKTGRLSSNTWKKRDRGAYLYRC